MKGANQVEVGELDNDVKEVLDDHGNRIQKLEIDSEVSKERWKNITEQLTRIESNSLATSATNNALLASNNTVLKTMEKLVDSNTVKDTNNTQVVTVKNNNRKEIWLKVLWIISLLILGFFAVKGVNISVPIF